MLPIVLLINGVGLITGGFAMHFGILSDEGLPPKWDFSGIALGIVSLVGTAYYYLTSMLGASNSNNHPVGSS